jgi:uncharacterized protein with HEPN domain
MTQHDPAITLRQMLEYARHVITLSSGRSRDELQIDIAFFLAVTRALEIAGEAARRLPDWFHRRYPEVDWYGLMSFRNRLAHAYDLLDMDLLWKAITEETPALIRQLERIIPEWPIPED